MKILTDDIIHRTAILLSAELFECGNELKSPVHRIQFMGGEYPDNERAQGGLNQAALTAWLESALRRHL